MLSREADSCFWIGRYVERAEATARMVDVHYHAALEGTPTHPTETPATDRDNRADSEDDPISTLRWQSILTISGDGGVYRRRYPTENDRDVLHFFAFDRDHPNSILSVWQKARDNARAIREQIASEMWESLNVSCMRLKEWDVDRVLETSPYEFFQMVKDSSHLFQGILNRTMIMGEARDWLDTGRFLERAGQTARLLDVKFHDLLPAFRSRGLTHDSLAGAEPYGVGGALDTHGWIAVLRSVSAYEMFRKTHQEGISPSRIVDFLVLNPQFPASVRHGVGRVEGCLRRISGNVGGGPPSNEPEQRVADLCENLSGARPREIIKEGLHEFLEGIQDDCNALGNAITRTYLSY